MVGLPRSYEVINRSTCPILGTPWDCWELSVWCWSWWGKDTVSLGRGVPESWGGHVVSGNSPRPSLSLLALCFAISTDDDDAGQGAPAVDPRLLWEHHSEAFRSNCGGAQGGLVSSVSCVAGPLSTPHLPASTMCAWFWGVSQSCPPPPDLVARALGKRQRTGPSDGGCSVTYVVTRDPLPTLAGPTFGSLLWMVCSQVTFRSNRGLPCPRWLFVCSAFRDNSGADDGGSAAPVDDLELVGEPCSDPSGSGALSSPRASSGMMSGPLPASAHGASTLTLTLTSDPVALSLYYEWSLEEVKAVLREVFCLESRTQVGLQRRVARCRTSCSRSLPPPFCACRRKLVSRVRGCL